MQLLHTNDANLECALVSLSVESSRAEVFFVWRYDCFLMFFMADPDTTRRFRLHSHTANGEMIKNLMLCSLPEVFLLELQYLLCQSHACVCVQSQLHMCALSPLFFSSPLFSWQPISSVAIVTLHSLSALFWKSNLIEPKTKHPPLHTHTHTHSHAHTPLTHKATWQLLHLLYLMTRLQTHISHYFMRHFRDQSFHQRQTNLFYFIPFPRPAGFFKR